MDEECTAIVAALNTQRSSLLLTRAGLNGTAYGTFSMGDTTPRVWTIQTPLAEMGPIIVPRLPATGYLLSMLAVWGFLGGSCWAAAMRQATWAGVGLVVAFVLACGVRLFLTYARLTIELPQGPLRIPFGVWERRDVVAFATAVKQFKREWKQR